MCAGKHPAHGCGSGGCSQPRSIDVHRNNRVSADGWERVKNDVWSVLGRRRRTVACSAESDTVTDRSGTQYLDLRTRGQVEVTIAFCITAAPQEGVALTPRPRTSYSSLPGLAFCPFNRSQLLPLTTSPPNTPGVVSSPYSRETTFSASVISHPQNVSLPSESSAEPRKGILNLERFVPPSSATRFFPRPADKPVTDCMLYDRRFIPCFTRTWPPSLHR